MNKKRGNIEVIFLTFMIIIMCIILSTFYILYTQINAFLYPIKQDIYYIVQNVYFSFNDNELAYYNYEIDETSIKEKVENILNNNYKNVFLDYLYYSKNENMIRVEVTVKIKPIVLHSIIGDINLKIKDDVKLKLMDVK